MRIIGLVRSRRPRRSTTEQRRTSSRPRLAVPLRAAASAGRALHPRRARRAKAWPTARTRAEDIGDLSRTPSWRPSTSWSDRFAAFVARKGKLEPGVYRAYSYELAPGRRWADLKLKWRRAAPEGGVHSSPASRLLVPREQQALGINRDTGLVGDEERRRAAAGARLPASQSFSSVMSGASGFFMPTTW